MPSTINVILEYNTKGYLAYCQDYPGAFSRGATKEQAFSKIKNELKSYLSWIGYRSFYLDSYEIKVVQSKQSTLAIHDADTDILFDSEKKPISRETFEEWKHLVLRSASDFLAMYEAIPDQNFSNQPLRKTFYGVVPRSAKEMYEHTNEVTAYYMNGLSIKMPLSSDIISNRILAMELLEEQHELLNNNIFYAPDGEAWTLSKVMRRFLWHDRIHAKAMYRMAVLIWGNRICNPFCFPIGKALSEI